MKLLNAFSFINSNKREDDNTKYYLNRINHGVFRDCINLSNTELPESIESIGNAAFYNCTSLSNIILPENIESIGDSAFSRCEKLSSLNLPESLQEIGSNALYNNCIKGIDY